MSFLWSISLWHFLGRRKSPHWNLGDGRWMKNEWAKRGNRGNRRQDNREREKETVRQGEGGESRKRWCGGKRKEEGGEEWGKERGFKGETGRGKRVIIRWKWGRGRKIRGVSVCAPVGDNSWVDEAQLPLHLLLLDCHWANRRPQPDSRQEEKQTHESQLQISGNLSSSVFY